ncbi:MAG: hypothetical protein AAF442_09420 [Pseudomonadota bacterium]
MSSEYGPAVPLIDKLSKIIVTDHQASGDSMPKDLIEALVILQEWAENHDYHMAISQ